jgi:hypothetical protein
MKKWLSIAVLAGLILSLMPVTNASAQEQVLFRDVPATHWAYQDVTAGVQKGYINGLPDGTFAPERPVSRSEFIKMITAALNLPVEAQQEGEAWYVPYTRAALNSGLIDANEYADGDFTKEMTRMEMVRVAVKAFDETVRGQHALNEELMLKAVENGMIRGIDGKTVPEGLSSRAQAVTVIERVLKLRGGETLPVDENALEVAKVEYRIATGDIWEIYQGYEVIDHAIARYIEFKVLESIYIEDGHLKGYLPPIPEGTFYHMGIRAEYDPKDKVVSDRYGTHYMTAGKKLNPGEHFSLPIKDMKKVKEIIIRVTLENAEMPANRRATIMYYLDNKRIVENIFY